MLETFKSTRITSSASARSNECSRLAALRYACSRLIRSASHLERLILVPLRSDLHLLLRDFGRAKQRDSIGRFRCQDGIDQRQRFLDRSPQQVRFDREPYPNAARAPLEYRPYQLPGQAPGPCERPPVIRRKYSSDVSTISLRVSVLPGNLETRSSISNNLFASCRTSVKRRSAIARS